MLKWGGGIAVQFDRKWPNIKETLTSYSPNIGSMYAHMIDVNNVYVFNLITKDKYYNKPTYDTLRSSLNSMKCFIEAENIKYLGMPRIGCGLDKLNWNLIKPMICDIFYNIDVEIQIWKI